MHSLEGVGPNVYYHASLKIKFENRNTKVILSLHLQTTLYMKHIVLLKEKGLRIL
jgi:hypothetical protein